MTYLQAALTILGYADRTLTVGELTSIAVAQSLVRPRGRTPDRSMSSVLYRRMAADPDAPMLCENGRFWLRGRVLPDRGSTALRPAIRHFYRRGKQAHADGYRPGHARTAALPPPPFAIPAADLLRLPSPQPVANLHERAIARLDAALLQCRRRFPSTDEAAAPWSVEATYTHLVSPVLTKLGYRRVDQQPAATSRGRRARLLRAQDGTTILLETLRAGLALTDLQARPALARARPLGAAWVLLTNGGEIRLYAAKPALGAGHDSLAVRVLRIPLYRWTDDAERLDTARLLWLTSREAVSHGSLDAYLAARAVGAALLRAFDDPASGVVSALVAATLSSTSLQLPAEAIAHQARLAIRGARGRDGEPAPADVVAVTTAYEQTQPALPAALAIAS